ncbi:MAG: nucleotide exchange factor GrpE [Thaumarchaeota archaeon 13_1_40CM_3_50_5]|nr:MAG: nucleotide exchange factor GrpE [Thaumarchaeota archaeon 13_1_40CM_3_50_5]
MAFCRGGRVNKMYGAPSKNQNNEIYSAADASVSDPDSAASVDDINNGKKRESRREELEEERLEDIDALRKELNSVREELRKAKESSEASLNKLKYLMADFDKLLLKFLNIRDDLLRALSVAKKSKTEPVVIEGLEGILRNIDSLLSSEGVREIETVGTPFDPNIHDAVAHSARDDMEENTVTAEIRKGYMLYDKVLRPSLVEISKIVKNSVSDTNKEPDSQGG